MQSTQKPILTIGLIVKNEIRCLERCLKSLKPLRDAVPCEVIIADTGSDDGSWEVAEQYADQVFYFEWINDFAAARNAVIDRASGQWFFTIDADEWLDEDCSELIELFQDPKMRTHFNVGSLTVRNYFSADFSDDASYGEFIAIRLFKLLPGVRYHGEIHELPTYPPQVECYCMRGAVLHHDGYRPELTKAKDKGNRNMTLLREKLKKDPNNLLVLKQCIESSSDGPEVMEYIHRAFQGISEKWANWEGSGPSIFYYAISEAYKRKLPEFWDWVNQAIELYPKSIIVCTSVNYVAFCFSREEKNYAEAIRWGEAYLQAIKDYQANLFDQRELFSSVPSHISPLYERSVRAALADAYYEEKDYHAALKMLCTLDASLLSDQQVVMLIGNLFNLQTHSDINLTNAIKAFWKQLSSPVPDAKRANQRIKAASQTAMRAFSRKFQEAEDDDKEVLRHAYTLFLPLDEQCGLGIAAALMESNSLAETDRLLSLVTDWDTFPIHALARAIEAGAAFPLPGVPLPIEELDSLAARLSGVEDDFLQELCVSITPPDNIEDLNWARALLLAAVQTCKWENHDRDLLLVRRFVELERKFLPLLYTPQALEGDGLLMLAPVHRFGVYLIRAFDALDAGDWTKYIQLIRDGLTTCESMKPMAEFLRDLTEKNYSEPSSELLSLANRVKVLLASYPEDSPMVKAILENPEYQKVAHLIKSDLPVYHKYPLS